MVNRVQEIKDQIRDLQIQLQKENHNLKKSKGILKEGDWLKVDVSSEDGEPNDVIIFFRAPQGVVCMNGYFDYESDYVYDILTKASSWETWKAKKITKEEEAIKYL